MYQKTRYVYDREEKKQFVSAQFPVNLSVNEYMDWKGYQEEEELKHAEKKYGKNMYDLLFVIVVYLYRFLRKSASTEFSCC